jgi:hypothetical protein
MGGKLWASIAQSWKLVVVAWACAAAVALPRAALAQGAGGSGSGAPGDPSIDDHPEQFADAEIRPVGEYAATLGRGSWANPDIDAWRFAVEPGALYLVEVDATRADALAPVVVRIQHGPTGPANSWNSLISLPNIRGGRSVTLATAQSDVLRVTVGGVSSGVEPDAVSQPYLIRASQLAPPGLDWLSSLENSPGDVSISGEQIAVDAMPGQVSLLPTWLAFEVLADQLYGLGVSGSSFIGLRRFAFQAAGSDQVVELSGGWRGYFASPQNGRLFVEIPNRVQSAVASRSFSFRLITMRSTPDDFPDWLVAAGDDWAANVPLGPMDTWFTVRQSHIHFGPSQNHFDRDFVRLTLNRTHAYVVQTAPMPGEASPGSLQVSVIATSQFIGDSSPLLARGFARLDGQESELLRIEPPYEDVVLQLHSASTDTAVAVPGTVQVRIVDLGPQMSGRHSDPSIAIPVSLGQSTGYNWPVSPWEVWYEVVPTPPAGAILSFWGLGAGSDVIDVQSNGSHRVLTRSLSVPLGPIVTAGHGVFVRFPPVLSMSTAHVGTLTISSSGVAPRDELADTPEAATLMSGGTIDQAVVRQSVADQDYFAFNVTQPCLLHVNNPSVELTRPDGSSMTVLGTVELRQPGRYVGRVMFPDQQDQVTLRVTLSCHPTVFSPDEPAGGTLLPIGQTLTTSMSSVLDEDTFFSPATSGHVLEIGVSNVAEVWGPLTHLPAQVRMPLRLATTSSWSAWPLSPSWWSNSLPMRVPQPAFDNDIQTWFIVVPQPLQLHPPGLSGLRFSLRAGPALGGNASMIAPWQSVDGPGAPIAYSVTVRDLGPVSAMPEQGDTSAQATPSPLNQTVLTVPRQQSPGSWTLDQDWMSFPVQAGHKYVVEFPEGGDLQGPVPPLTMETCGTSNGSWARHDFIASSSGTVRFNKPRPSVIVGSAPVVSGMRIRDLGFKPDVDGTFSTARVIQPGERIEGEIFPLCENDTIVVAPRANFRIAMRVSTTPESRVETRLDPAAPTRPRFALSATSPSSSLASYALTDSLRRPDDIAVVTLPSNNPVWASQRVGVRLFAQLFRANRAGEPYVISSFRLGRVADVAGVNQVQGPDGRLTVDDWIVFIGAYFAGDMFIADVARAGGASMPPVGGPVEPDGQLTADDFIAFISSFVAP